MSAASATDVMPMDSNECDWNILREHRCNVIVEGNGTGSTAAVRLLLSYTGDAVVSHGTDAPLELPGRETKTFILRNAASLSASDQARLLDWFRDTDPRTQIISTTERPLFTLVEGGLFDATLYYRLNIMLLRVGATESYPIEPATAAG